ncbi:hypothetical protein J7E89_01275 [Streptomyces sp. ISL-100]|nr:hypothetical protein [Streptomyces sp. ISL-100]MBT2394641.1 hypothetical protein [Streptomyces sp. ISL-100]
MYGADRASGCSDTRLVRPVQPLEGRDGASASEAPALAPGQYTDTIGPGETRWYALRLDAKSAADLAVTTVPQPGVKAAFAAPWRR